MVMIYSLKNFEIDRYKTYELGSILCIRVFKGLEVGVTELFADLV